MKCTKTREVLIEVEIIRITKKRRAQKKPAEQTRPVVPGEDGDRAGTFAKTANLLKKVFDELSKYYWQKRDC